MRRFIYIPSSLSPAPQPTATTAASLNAASTSTSSSSSSSSASSSDPLPFNKENLYLINFPNAPDTVCEHLPEKDRSKPKALFFRKWELDPINNQWVKIEDVFLAFKSEQNQTKRPYVYPEEN